MKKKGILVIILTLILIFSTIAILSASNQSPIFLNPHSNNIGAITKSYTGSGNQLNAILYITNNYNNAPNAANTASNIYIPCPSGWKIIWTNLTLTNINAPNTTIESNYPTPKTSLDLSHLYAMSFRLTNNAYLDSISAQLYVINLPPTPTADFYVYNAENNGGKPRPLNPIASNTSIAVPAGTSWLPVSFGRPFLNTSETYDNTFFIAINSTSLRTPRWNATQEASPPANGYVYYHNGLWLENQSYDCQLIVNVSASTAPAESVKPSEIGLTINGTPVSGDNKGSGEWINSTASLVSNGHIFYDVNSTWMSTVSFSYVWNITILRDAYASALTNFDVSYNSNASWNITLDATGAFPLTNGVNHINITGIPSDWGNTSSKAYNGSQWIPMDSYPPDTISFPASNGTWTVNCTAPNYVSDIGFEVDGVPVENATVDDDFNFFVTFNTSISGTIILNIYDPSQILNYTDSTTVNGANNATFTWNVGGTAKSSGPYNVTISLNGALVSGYNETSLEVVPLITTALKVTSFPEEATYPSLIPVIVYYNDTANNLGITNATITAWEGLTLLTISDFEDLGNGYYRFNLQLPTVFGVHNVHFNASKRLYNSSGSIPLSINYLAPAGTVLTNLNPLFIVLLSNTMRQNQNFMSYLIIGAVVGSVVAAGVVGNRVQKRRGVPLRAMASLENIIVDHVPSGVTVWAFDFLKMETDVSLVSGFMSAVKSFLGEMKKGGLRKMETEFGTFIREDGDFLTATCITSGNTLQEEEWIRNKLHSFVTSAEHQNLDALLNWKGNVSVFKASFLEILSSLIDLEKAEELQREKILKILRERDRLQAELNNLGSKLDNLNQQFTAKKISDAELQARKAEIEPKYDKIQMEYIRTSIFLSKVPYTLEAVWETPKAREDIEKIRDKFIEIRMKIDTLQRKEKAGSISSKELKRKEKLKKELKILIEELDKTREK